MTLEDELKALILTQHRSIREFSSTIGLPQSTIDSILKRGIMNAGIGNIIKICNHLKISTDKLAQGQIIPIDNTLTTTALTLKEKEHIENYRRLDANGREPVDSVIEKLQEQHSEKSDEPSVTPWQSAINS